MPKVLNIRHIGIVVDSLTVALHFYVRILGFREVNRGVLSPAKTNALLSINKKLHWVKLKLPVKDRQPYIELYFFPNGRVPMENDSPHHISITVQDIEHMFKKMNKLDLVLSKEIVTTDIAKVFFGLDPDGNIIEFVEEL